MPSPHRRKQLVFALGMLAGCSPDTGPAMFAGLDADGDGALRPGDLEPGTAGLYLWRRLADAEPIEEAHISTSAELLYDETLQHWIFRAPLQGVPEYMLHMPFDPDSGELGPSIGATPLLGVEFDVPAREHSGAMEPGGEFNVTEAGDTASGWVELDALVAMRSHVQLVETGEQLRLVGVAFSDIEVRR